MKKLKRSLAAALLTLSVLSSEATAHPMGNFSINHHSTVHVSQGSINVETILDFAEIPTFQMFPET